MRMALVLALLVPQLALGAPAPAASPSPSPSPSSSPSSNDLNFNLFNEQPKNPAVSAEEAKKAAELDRKVKLRRSLLTWHQGFGFATLGLLAASLVVGTLSYVDKYGGGDDTGKYLLPHYTLAGVTSAAFATTGILALAAPNPYPKPIKFDAALVHKLSMALATACFVTQLILGPITSAADGKLYQRDLALTHLVVGYAAFGFMFTGTLAFVAK